MGKKISRKTITYKAERKNRIKDVLRDKGKSQEWLAEQLHIDLQSVNGYLNNATQPSLETLFAIAEVLNIDPQNLLDR